MSEAPSTDDVSITAGGQKISGWQTVAITRSIETCPNSFELGYTEQGGVGETVAVTPGAASTISIGSDLVITGYADVVISELEAASHQLQIAGRGKCQDLVDCTAEWPTAVIANADVLEVANKLAAPYGLTAALGPNTTLSGPQPAFNITLTDTPFALIEEMARYYQVLPYEGPDGNLVLAAVGQTAHASGFVEGQNVLGARVVGAMDQRFSEYVGYLNSTQVYGDTGAGANQAATQTDPNVTRHRRRAIIAEAPGGFIDLLNRRVTWERTRRAGRGLQVIVTVDSWRDSAGKLWTPNQIAPITLPSQRVTGVRWIIGEVTYLRDAEAGTRARVTLMPPQAYSPEPIQLMPLYSDLTPVNGGQ